MDKLKLRHPFNLQHFAEGPRGSSFVGLHQLVYSIILEDTAEGTTYGDVKPFARAISANVATAQESATQYTDNGPTAVITQTGETTLTIGTPEVPDDVLCDILGQEMMGGVIAWKQEAIPPYVALGFIGDKENGAEKCVWLVKGRFTIPSSEINTKTNSPTFQDASIVGTFIRRNSDKVFKITGDTDNPDFKPYRQGFFDTVFDYTKIGETPDTP